MPEDHFGPDVAARYDEDSAAMYAPEALDPASRSWPRSPATGRRWSSRSAPAGSASRSPRAASR